MTGRNTLEDPTHRNGSGEIEPADSLLIESIRIAAFGRFVDVHIDDVKPGLNVVYGPNEAGKSTLYSFFSTMLFGVYPTNPEQHPYMPEEARYLEGAIHYSGRGGRKVSVERKLMSSPSGSITVDGKTDRLNQSTLPEAEFLSRDVYSSVFALTLDDLVAPRSTPVWEKIQDRLLGGSAIDTLRSSREVIADLETEASALWRDSRRGKPRADELARKITECKREERDAAQRGDAVRSLTDELTGVEKELSDLVRQKRSIDARLARLRTILPVDRLLRTLDECRRESGEVDRFDAVPDDPIGTLKSLESRRAEDEEGLQLLQAKRDRCLQEIASAGDIDRRLAEAAADIRRWEVRCGELRRDRERLHKDTSELERHKADRDAVARELLTGGWTNASGEQLSAISLADLRATVDGYVRARREEDELRRRPLATQRPARRISTPILWAVGVLGAVLFLTGVFLGNAIIAALGAILTTFSAVRLADRPPPEAPDAISRDEVSAAAARCETLRLKVSELLSGLDIPVERLSDPDASLVHDVQTLIARHETAERARDAVEELRRDVSATRNEFDRYVDSLALEGQISSNADIDRQMEDLANLCAEGSRRVRSSESAREAIGEHEEAILRLESSIAQFRDEADGLREVLNEIGDGDIHAGAIRLAGWREMRAHSRTIERQIRERAGSIADAVLLVEEAKVEDPELFDDQAEPALESDRAAVDENLLRLTGRRSDLLKDLESLKSKPSLADVQGELEQLQVDLHETKWERDRLALAAAIVRSADARYRAEHQPDVVRRASTYFESMTGGRYDRISLDGDALTVRLSADHRYLDLTAAESRVSRGTRDQLYLALRLALIDHLDASHTRLPVFLDEVLVNWDSNRRVHGLKTIAAMSRDRQIFLFTCHEWLRDEAAAHALAHVISLE